MMPILVNGDDIRNGTKGQHSSQPVTGATGVSGLIFVMVGEWYCEGKIMHLQYNVPDPFHHCVLDSTQVY